jgi:hypothetical protein
VTVGAGGASSTTRGADVKTNAYDFIPKDPVDPLSLLVGDKPLCTSLVIPVRVWIPTEIASEHRLCLVGSKGRREACRLVSSLT